VQFRRGTTAQTAVFTGAQGEITVDTDKKTAVVHDGSTVGGFALLREVDGFRRTNNLSEVTNRSIARDNLDAAGEDDLRRLLGQRSPRAGLHFGGASTQRVSGPVGSALALGTADFSIFFVAQARTWTPSANYVVFNSHSAGNNRFAVSVLTTGAIAVTFYDAAGSSTNAVLTPDVPLVAGEVYAFVISLDRDGNATLFVNGISDRDKNATSVSVSIAAHAGINIGSGNTNGYQVGFGFYGLLYAFAIFNRLLNAADALLLAHNADVEFADQHGSLTTVNYQSNFSAGADGFVASVGLASVTGNVDAISDGSSTRNDVLRLTTDTSNGAHYSVRAPAEFLAGKRYRLEITYYIPSTNTAATRLRFAFSSISLGESGVEFTTAGTWVTETREIVGLGIVGMYMALTNAGGTSFTGVASESVYVASIKLTPLGAILDLDFENADPAYSLTVRDRAGGADGTATASGIYQSRRTLEANVGQITIGGGAMLKKVLSNTAALDFGSIAAAASADLTITVNGAAVGDSVSLGLPSAPSSGIVYQAFVSAVNAVTVRATNITAAAIDPVSNTFRITVIQF
jgi:hypothetical protein